MYRPFLRIDSAKANLYKWPFLGHVIDAGVRYPYDCHHPVAERGLKRLWGLTLEEINKKRAPLESQMFIS